ncbi:8616_t:CDS:1, partial [Gigaspora margarita]
MPKSSEPNEYREKEDRQESSQENELEDVISEVDDNVDMLVEDFSIENNPGVQELIDNIEEYIHLIDQLVVTEDALMDKGIIEMVNYEFHNDDNKTDNNNNDELSPPPITTTETTEALEKVIKFQESLVVRKGFNEKELK